MKKYFLTFVLSISITYLFSQSKIDIKEQTEDIGGGNHSSLIVKIFQCKEDIVSKEWKRLMKDYDAKVSMKKEIFADNAKIKDLSENLIDVYAKIETNSDGEITLVVGFDLGGAFLSSSQHPKEFKAAKRIVAEFAKDMSEKGFKERIKAEEKALITLTKQKDYTLKENEGLTRDIENFKEKVTKAEEKIKINLENLKTKDLDILNQQKLIETLNKNSDIK